MVSTDLKTTQHRERATLPSMRRRGGRPTCPVLFGIVPVAIQLPEPT